MAKHITVRLTKSQLADIICCLSWGYDMQLGYGQVPPNVETLRKYQRERLIAKLESIEESDK